MDIDLSDTERKDLVNQSVRASVDFGRSDQTGVVVEKSPERAV